MEDKNTLRVVENPVVVERYDKLKALGKRLFTGIEINDPIGIVPAHVELARKFMTEGAKIANPEVWASYWEHVIIAPELGKRIAQKLLPTNSGINPAEVEFLLWLHDIGRLVSPAAYLRNDLIGDRLLKEAGLPRETIAELPDIGKLMVKADELELTEDQSFFKEDFNPDQKKLAQEYFDSLTPVQRIVNLADNLGKRQDGEIFDVEKLILYLKNQEGRYDLESHWASIHWAIPRRRAGAVLQAYTIQKTAEWLKNSGVDINEILGKLKDYGPKFVLIARHGELDNPTNIVYNRDAIMQEPIHLSREGAGQMQKLGDLINAKKFKPVRIYVSPETRAKESTQNLNNKLGVKSIEITDDLDDIDASGPYREGMKMDEFAKLDGNVYDKSRWEQYHHEIPEDVAERMHHTFTTLALTLSAGQTGILLSHGDPIAWLANYLDTQTIPNPKDLRDLIYPSKGDSLVTVIGPDNEVFTLYLLNENSKGERQRKIY